MSIGSLFQKGHRASLAMCLVLGFVFSLSMLTTGIFGNQAIYRTDDVIHIAYINELIHEFPPQNPGYSGVPLLGYHFFSDLFISSIHSLSTIRIEYLYFHFVPLLTALLWSLCVYSFLYIWKGNKLTGVIGVLLSLFGGSFGFLLRLQGYTQVSLSSTFGIDQPSTALLNPPYAMSIVFILAGLFFMYEYVKTQKLGWGILLGFTIGITPMFKVYAGMILIVLFLLLALRDLFQKRFTLVKIGIGSVILVLLTYGIFAGKGGFLIWYPLWAPHKILVDSMPWYGYAEKIATYTSFGMWWRVLGVELYGVGLYVFGNLGTRLIGLVILFLLWLRKPHIPSVVSVAVGVALLFSLGIPLLFIQSIKVFEIIQLAWYSMLFASLLGAHGLSFIIAKSPRLLRPILVIVLLISTLASTYENTLSHVYPGRSRVHARIDADPYFSILQYLSQDSDYKRTVLELPPKVTPPEWNAIMAWYRTTLPYIPAFGNKRSYFQSQNIDFPNVKVEPHLERIATILTIESIPSQEASLSAVLQVLHDDLKKEQIGYILSPFPLSNVSLMKNTNQVLHKAPFSLYRIE